MVVGSSPAARAKQEIMAGVVNYIRDSYEELVEKVTWPTWAELSESAVLVFVASLIIAGIVKLMDFVFGVNTNDFWKGIIGFIYDAIS